MDSTKSFIRCLLIDIEEYLQYVEDFGNPNYKYFNFVLNKLGLMHVFLYKSNIFKNKHYSMVKFIDLVLLALKKKFIDEKSNLKRAAIIFLISKIYFTDEIAINLKLRIQCEEWGIFKAYIKEIKGDIEYQSICLIFFQLFTENFFKFTLKTQTSALDYGGQSAQCSSYDECLNSSTPFWNTIESNIKHLDQVRMKELTQLCKIREEHIKPFESLLPEKTPIDEVVDGFTSLKTSIQKCKGSNESVSRKEMIAVCRDYMSRRSDKRCADLFESDADIGVDIDNLLTTNPRSKRGKKKAKGGGGGLLSLQFENINSREKSLTTSDSEFSDKASSSKSLRVSKRGKMKVSPAKADAVLVSMLQEDNSK